MRRPGRLASFFLRFIVAIAAVGYYADEASAQLRIVDYNIAQNYDVAGDPGGLDVIFTAIGAEVRNGFAKPIDVLAVQEADDDGSDAVALAAILNGIYGVTTYAAAPVPANGDSGGNGLPGLVYNSASVSLLGTIAFGDVGSGNTQQPRSSLRYQLRPTGYDVTADFYIYNNHYKSDDGSVDQARRNVEAQEVRANSDALGEGTHAIYVGDFNVYRSTEAMYQTLLAAGVGQAHDPLNPLNVESKWSAPSETETFKAIHTQSPATIEAFTGQVLGGMDDRFDFQLITGELQDGEGMSQLASSYRTFGNNGTHMTNGAITTGTGAAPDVLTALAQSSDHLPVVADYQLPAKLGVQVASIPSSAATGAAVSIDVLIENLASAVTSIGADELDYTLSVTGDLLGGTTGTIAALAAGQTQQFSLNTSTPGLKSGVVTISTSSQGAANALFTLPVSFIVGGGGEPVRTVIAKDDFDAPLNLISFSQSPAAETFLDSQDGFQRYQVGVSSSIPNDLMDDSTSTAPNDAWGIINRAAKIDGWFGLADTFNDQNPTGDVTAAWSFNISGASALEVSIDMGAMGNFEPSDVFNWTFSIDGAPFVPLFTSIVHDGVTANYTLADGDTFEVIDPVAMTIAGGDAVQLSNVLQTLTASILGTGDVLTLQFAGNTNGDDEAYAFDNIIVTGLLPSFAETDFNEDGFVDGDDLATWQTNFGLLSGAMKDDGDADLDGDVDGADFLAWQRQWTGGGAMMPTTTAVPEPSSAMVLVTALLCFGRRREIGQG
jgi:hypothetical protein